MAKRKSKKNKLIFCGAALLLALGAGTYFMLNKSKGDFEIEIPNLVKKEEPVKKVQIVDLDSNSRPYAVMINNVNAVWPYQSGLMDAYMVYELLVEGGITREMALFKDASTEKIASIRSSRHYYLDYVLENDAIYVHWGWSPQAQSDIKSLGINNINGLTYEGKYFFRDNSVKASSEHRGYTKMSSLKDATSKLGYRTTSEKGVLLNYDVDDVKFDEETSIDATTISIPFSNSYTVKFVYDSEAGVYKKYQNSTLMKDYTSGEEYTTKNIITYKVGYNNISGDEKGRQNMNNTGSGSGYYISKGKAVKINWKKDSRSSRTVYTLEDGTPLTVNDGNTFIELQPNNRELTISADTSE